MKKYIIGIDFGTTNCTMAYALAESGICQIEQFAIPQITAAGLQGEEGVLPSFLYFPLPEELKSKAAAVEWDANRVYCAGLFAKNRGAELPSRMIASAKSWLCHSGIDRRASLLPLEGEEQEAKMSPLKACSELLRHLREAWDSKMPKASFCSQEVLVTVPASFDPSARQLVLEAAEMAGYPEITLLEEPQAAFYAWLYRQDDQWRKQLKVHDQILVVDIGGGTTDFSLISVDEEEGNLSLRRVAVGAHLLLGGDNIDLSLAHITRQKFEEQGRLIDDWQFQGIIHACRQAKEALLGEKPPKSFDITVAGRGSKLVGGAVKTFITHEEVSSLVLDGFLPLVSPRERSPKEQRAGIQQIGLPYAQDPRITSQLAKFLAQNGDADHEGLENFIFPTAVLFNGGTAKSASLRNRVVDLLNQWASDLNKDKVKVLTDPDFDFAVSRGAVYYGFARKGKGIRIKSGTSRSYFIGVEDSAPAVPGMAAPLKAVCVVPFGMEEGTERRLADREFALVLGERASFRFFSHSAPKLPNGAEPDVGTVIKSWKKDLSELHTLDAALDKAEGDGKTVCVELKSRVTELGVLELWCESPDGRKWKLEFDIRENSV